MSVQVGTVDGLINITPVIKDCFVKAIESFALEVVKSNKLGELSIGDAFQRYTYPVYSKLATKFDLKSLEKEVTTKTGKKQSPAYVTYCKKMGLLETDGSKLFQLTPVGQALNAGEIDLHEYALLYMSKQGIFIDGQYKENLLVHVANIFKVSSSVTTDELLLSIATKYGDSDFQKTRSDIILGALCTAKILCKINNTYVLAGIAQAQILDLFAENGKYISPALLDTNPQYADYVGTFKYGLYDFLNEKNISSFAHLYPNLMNYLQEKDKQNPSLPLQQIFYGAPGTGKSHKVKEVTDSIAKEFVFRTTFHPDSDYSTFVGAYKPTMENPDNRAYTVGQLIDKLSEIKNTGCTYPCQKFAAKYWYALKQLSATEIKEIISACGFTDSMKVEIDKSIPVGEELAKNNTDSKIVYSFVPQAFLKAYVAAWKNQNQPVFLVIEEINRGNCAQIFGDIFQLLDRNENGESEYPIKADQDIRDYLAKEFAGVEGLENNIQSGEELMLPANLHIWATMNTSDQSLFPIDSAFKRRWDWKYVPIQDSGEKWRITLSDAEYDWWSFVEKINEVIGDMTSSEDKKLGYFFCKACDKKIDAEKFVNKVIFYLWNDVLKDYELPEEFKYGELKNKGNSKSDYMSFNDFYESDGSADEVTIAQLMKNLKVTEFDKEQSLDMTEEESSVPSKTSLSVSETKRFNFWTEFIDFSKDKASMFADKKPTYALWKNFSIDGIKRSGAFINIEYIVSQKAVRVNLITSKEVYQNLEENKSAFELKLAGLSLEWRPSFDAKNSAIRIVRNDVDFDSVEERESLFQFIVDTANRLREGAKEFIK